MGTPTGRNRRWRIAAREDEENRVKMSEVVGYLFTVVDHVADSIVGIDDSAVVQP